MNDLLLSSAFLKRLLFDQAHIRRSQWRSLIKSAQRDQGIPLFRDRELELMEYFHIPRFDLWKLYLSKGFPNTMRFKHYLDSFFEARTSQNVLKTAYEDAAFCYSVRLMLAFERFTMVSPYLDTLFKFYGRLKHSLDGLKVLEYGCGVSDIGLLLRILGADVTICDLSDKKLSFAEWRYRKRNLDVEVISLNNTEEIPELGRGRYDLVIATEVFEHVRDPLGLLHTLTASLRQGGFLFDSMGGRFERELCGDHLTEAIEIGNSEEYKSFYREHYLTFEISESLNYLFQYKG